MCTDNNSKDSRPITPSDTDCCHSGCDPCIFDVHTKLLEEYNRRKEQNIKIQSNQNILYLCAYTNFVIINVEEISECYILLLLKCQENDVKNDRRILINPGQHVMLHLHDTSRPYTPISFTDDSIEFLIRLYPNGKFSKYLKSVKIGDIVRVRGPYGNFKYETNSMGSGIAAVYPIAKSIIDNELDETKIHLIGGFKNISQIPLKRELQTLSDYWNFKCTLYISQLQNIYNLHGINVKSGRLTKESVSEALKNKVSSDTLILICGTRQFNSSIEQWIKCMDYTHVHIFE